MTLVDKLVSLISIVQIEKHNSEITLKRHFSQLYEELRGHLGQAYDEIDILRAQVLFHGRNRRESARPFGSLNEDVL